MASAAPPNTGEHQPVPRLSAGLPFTLQLGSTGAGIGVGCGVGVGFLTPLNLGTIPVLGQAAQGISAGLGGVLGGAGQSARQAVRSLGVQGLDAGAGCGVLAGYFFGAGLMLKPSAVEQVVTASSTLVGQVTQRLQQAGHRRHPAAPPGASAALSPGQPGAGQVVAGPLQPQQQQQQQQQSSTAGMVGSTAERPPSSSSAQQPDALLMRTLLQQQDQLTSLRRETRALRAAVCKLDPCAAVCLRPRGSGGRSGSSDGGA